VSPFAPKGKPIDTEEELNRVVNIYDELEFYGSKRQDGTTADVNSVWLSRWYVDNLNALYAAPLRYGLWRTLNDKSPIASRLYEFLFFKSYGGRQSLRFNYPTLVKFIPARTERFLSHARKQLDPALQLLAEHAVRFDDAGIEEIKRVGGVAVAVASDEVNRRGVDAWKRNRLVGAGADIVIGEYRRHERLLTYLMDENGA